MTSLSFWTPGRRPCPRSVTHLGWMSWALTVAVCLLCSSEGLRALAGDKESVRVVANMPDGTKLPSPCFQELRGPQRPAVEGLSELKCFDMEYGWVFCRSEEEARQIAEDLRAAAGAFVRHFGIVPGRGVVVTVIADRRLRRNDLEKLGAQWILPWLDQKQAAAALEKSVLDQILRQLKAQGIPDAVLPQVVEQVKTQLKGGVLSAKRPLRHEVGHLWFVLAFWGPKALLDLDGAISGDNHYAGPANDWLDETAAVLMENDELTADRRQQFLDVVKADPKLVCPLAKFFTMPHPIGAGDAAGELRDPKTAASAGDVQLIVEAQTVVDDDQKTTTDGGANFYRQCRAVADFLMERSKDERILRKIAESEAKGCPMAKWLADNGAKLGLPATIKELDGQFRSWAEGRRQRAQSSQEGTIDAPKKGLKSN